MSCAAAVLPRATSSTEFPHQPGPGLMLFFVVCCDILVPFIIPGRNVP